MSVTAVFEDAYGDTVAVEITATGRVALDTEQPDGGSESYLSFSPASARKLAKAIKKAAKKAEAAQ